jgi:uncharacterized membrane protein HdeD (DUF308 family)
MTQKSPMWLRIVQIGLGSLILFLSGVVLINPIIGAVSVIFFLALLLLFAGIEKVISGLFIPGKSKFASVGLGIIVIIVSLIALAYPVDASIFVVLLLGIALLVDGISRIVHGMRDKHTAKWTKSFSVGTGILSIILAIIVIALPAIGLIFAGILIGIALLVTSLQILSTGIKGQHQGSRGIDDLNKK